MIEATEPASSDRLSTRTKLGSVHPTSSPKKKVGFPGQDKPRPTIETPRRSLREPSIQTSPSIDETQPIDDFTDHPEPQRPIKSCMSVNNLADSLARMSRVVSAPNLSGMAPMKRSVSFNKIEIREYERTLGDNPCVSSGPPLTLGWKYNPDHDVFDVEEYENNKSPRSKAEMLMPREIREVVLKEYWGVSKSEMYTTTKDINIAKRNRRATARSSDSAERRREQMEKASRTMKRLVSLGRKKDEKKLWKDVKTMCGKRVHSMNDLPAYSAVSESLNNADRVTNDIASKSKSLHGIHPATTEVAEKPQYLSQDSLSSSGNGSATSLPAHLLEVDDDWDFGFDEYD